MREKIMKNLNKYKMKILELGANESQKKKDRAIEAKMLQDAKEGYRKQHEAIRMKMKARKTF